MTQTAAGPARQFVDQHRPTLERAVAAIGERGYWPPHPENPKAYGDIAEAKKHFEARLGQHFPLRQGGPIDGAVGAERSPYGPRLGVRYPRLDVDALIAAARRGTDAWHAAGALLRSAERFRVIEARREIRTWPVRPNRGLDATALADAFVAVTFDGRREVPLTVTPVICTARGALR